MSKKEYNKILIIRTGAIGDVVHTMNLVHAITKAYDKAQIHYLTSEVIMPLIADDPSIRKVITVNPKFKMFSDETTKLASELRAEKYDLVINLQPSLKIKYLIFLAGIKNKLTYRKQFKMHAVKNFWVTGLKAFPDLKEEEKLELNLPEYAINFGKDKVKDLKRPLIIFNAGGIMSKRQGRTYPLTQWIELGKKIQEKYDGTIILNGSRDDSFTLKPLEEIPNVVSYIGELSLVHSCGVISQADLMISGDSGPLHIATALGVKSIGLYGSMPEKRTGCYSSGINIVSKKECVPCNRRKCKYLKKTGKLYAPCMKEISVDEIMKKIEL